MRCDAARHVVTKATSKIRWIKSAEWRVKSATWWVKARCGGLKADAVG